MSGPRDVFDVVAAFSAGLRALDIRPQAVELSREDGLRLAAAVQDDSMSAAFTVARATPWWTPHGAGMVKVQIMGIEFRWPV